MNVDDLIFKYNIKLDNKHDLKFICLWNEYFRIQRANSMKDIYTLKEMNKTRFESIYTNNRLKQFKIKNVENSSTRQIEIHKMLNIAFKNSIDAIKKLNIIYKNVRIDDEIWNETVWNTAESSNADNQIFKNNIIDNNLLNSKLRNIHARIKSSTRRSNRLIEIENSLNSVERNTNITAFATIDEVSIEKK